MIQTNSAQQFIQSPTMNLLQMVPLGVYTTTKYTPWGQSLTGNEIECVLAVEALIREPETEYTSIPS